MVFNSISFLIFFALFFHLYWWINNKGAVKWRNIYLIIASYIFYGWWDWRFLGLIAISSLADYIIGLKIHSATSKRSRKALLIVSLVINLGILGFFKYFNFFVDSLALLFQSLHIPFHVGTLEIILPVGISFYTFQTMSYTIDIYRGQLKPTKSWTQFFAFVSFFPQLVAGPIERAAHLLPQFYNRKSFSPSRAASGLRLALWGFFKKIVIADNLAPIVEQVFANPNQYSGLGILAGAIAFAFQIYCDFSGYSDIAIGIGRTMGFDLLTNFNKPYFSKSFTEFWQRWHISLSTWFRDYVYIPLGGNRVSKTRNNLNLMITFVVSGLWHGANFTFILWGFLHGAMLILEKRIKLLQHLPAFVIFIITSLFWIPFRANNVSHLKQLIAQLFTFSAPNNWNNLLVFPSNKMIALSIVFIAFTFIEKLMGQGDFSESLKRFNTVQKLATYSMLIICILMLGNFDVKPNFIYFQF